MKPVPPQQPGHQTGGRKVGIVRGDRMKLAAGRSQPQLAVVADRFDHPEFIDDVAVRFPLAGRFNQRRSTPGDPALFALVINHPITRRPSSPSRRKSRAKIAGRVRGVRVGRRVARGGGGSQRENRGGTNGQIKRSTMPFIVSPRLITPIEQMENRALKNGQEFPTRGGGYPLTRSPNRSPATGRSPATRPPRRAAPPIAAPTRRPAIPARTLCRTRPMPTR